VRNQEDTSRPSAAATLTTSGRWSDAAKLVRFDQVVGDLADLIAVRSIDAASSRRKPRDGRPGDPERQPIGTPRPAPAESLLEVVRRRVEACLGALFVLVGGAAADADAANLHLAPGHDR